ncbi:MAG: Imm30 family immunity protein [Beijerinckiaceae bacterium]|nr:Imm30 family immunity protein [Beijerinckiaceae bacterium]
MAKGPRMTADVESALARVEAVLREEGDINEEFSKALENLLSLQNPRVLRGTLLLLDDSHELQDLMWAILHGAERFDYRQYAEAYVDVLPELHRKSPDWASFIMGSCLNSEKFRMEIKKRIYQADAETAAIARGICAALKEEHPAQFGVTAAEIIG